MASKPIYKETIDTFYGGISPDPRMQKSELFRMAQHFDTWTDPKRLVPFRAMEEDENKTYNIKMFLYANSNLYGLGQYDASHAFATVYKKNSDPVTGSWTASANGASASGAFFTQCFLAFHNYAYGGTGGTRIWAADLTGVAAFTETAYSTAGQPICQGIVTTDDKLIIPCGSGIAVKDGAGAGPTANWSTYSIVPASHVAVDIFEIGDLVGIAAKPAAGVGGVNSKIFLWDKVSSDPSGVIDCGDGNIVIADEIEGDVVAVMQVGGGTTFSIRPKLVARRWGGGSKAMVEIEIAADSGTSTLTIYGNHTKAKDGNRIIFGISIQIDGVSYNQLATIGRKTAQYPLAFTLDRLVDNDTALTGSVEGVGKMGDYIWVSHNGDGSVNRTNDQSSFIGVSPSYISQKLTGDSKALDAHRRIKQLQSAGLMCKPLTSGQSVSLYYRIDDETSWTLIRTYSYSASDENNNMQFEAGVDAAGDDFKNYRELQFKAVSAGGAEITALNWAWAFAGSDVTSE